MKRSCANQIVSFLSFSGGLEHAAAFQHIGSRDWKSALAWMDDANLALYFLKKLKDCGARGAVPSWVSARLEEDSSANQGRTAKLWRSFNYLNSLFRASGVRYAVVKGFSLVPSFCPDSVLRHQSDLDYFIDEQSLPLARQILLEEGYVPKESRSKQESIFVMSGVEPPIRGTSQYQATAAHSVELHLDFWDSDLQRLPSLPNLFSVDRATLHLLNGSTFPVLTETDAFLLQILHACQHLFTYWIRMSCLLEIAYFLSQHANDSSLWEEVEGRVGSHDTLREFVVIVTELSARMFAAPIPEAVRKWGQRLGRATRVWIDHYSRDSALFDMPYDFHLFPKSKLILLLQRQYEDAHGQRHVTDRLTKFTRVSHMVAALQRQPRLLLDVNWWRKQRPIQRSLFHLLAGLRYFCELPRWKWRNRIYARPRCS